MERTPAMPKLYSMKERVTQSGTKPTTSHSVAHRSHAVRNIKPKSHDSAEMTEKYLFNQE
jgi:hypothetical protein